jgi:dienelactone hydrolase
VRKKRLLALGLAFLALGLVATPTLSRWARATELLAELAAPPSSPGPLIEQDVVIGSSGGPIRARIYRRSDADTGRGLVVSHGVHHLGIDEPRLVPFARALARSGLVVLTPELDDLVDYRISFRGVEVIEEAVRFLGDRREVESREVGLLGFSFAGGLSLVAAADPPLDGRVSFVASVGGHHDLRRVLDFLVSGELETPSGARSTAPHEYGLVILVYEHMKRFVPPRDVETMEDAFRAWLHEERDEALALASRGTSQEAEQLFTLLESGSLGTLRAPLRSIIDDRDEQLQRLSPRGHLAAIGAPVYLLHGAHDSVIPPSETRWAARELRGQQHATLVTPLIEHVEVEGGASLSQKAELLGFMSRLL